MSYRGSFGRYSMRHIQKVYISECISKMCTLHILNILEGKMWILVKIQTKHYFKG